MPPLQGPDECGNREVNVCLQNTLRPLRRARESWGFGLGLPLVTLPSKALPTVFPLPAHVSSVSCMLTVCMLSLCHLLFLHTPSSLMPPRLQLPRALGPGEQVFSRRAANSNFGSAEQRGLWRGWWWREGHSLREQPMDLVWFLVALIKLLKGFGVRTVKENHNQR